MANRVAGVEATDRTAALRDAAGAASPLFVLGIDPGLDRTGYAVIDAAGARVLDAGLVRSDTGLPIADRLREIYAGIEEVLAEHPVGLMAVEDLYAHYAHPRTAILMGHARGVVLLAAARRGIEVLSLPATQIKKTITGSGRASKVQMQRAIKDLLNLPRLPEPSDVADALAAAICAAEFRTRRSDRPRKEGAPGLSRDVCPRPRQSP